MTQRKKITPLMVIIISFSFLVLLIISMVALNFVAGKNSGKEVFNDFDKDLSSTKQTQQNEIDIDTSQFNLDAYTSDNYYNDDYIMPESDSKEYKQSDIEKFTSTALKLVEAEIYARHGCVFEDPYVEEYLSFKDWYKPNKNISKQSVEDKMIEFETYNLSLIMAEQRKRGIEDEWIKRDIVFLLGTVDVLPYSDRRFYDSSEIKYLDQEELQFAREEIYKRHGDLFDEDDYKSSDDDRLNKYEKQNVSMILELEEAYENGEYRRSLPYGNITFSGFITTETASRYFSKAELGLLNKEMLRKVRNEIYANHGAIFFYEDIHDEFYGLTWYQPLIYADVAETEFNEYEKANIKTIIELEEAYGQAHSYGNPAGFLMGEDGVDTIPIGAARWYILPEFWSRYYTEAELNYLNKEQLRFARSEIYAEHGAYFSDADLQAYFNAMWWYNGSSSIYEVEQDFNQFERANVNTILAMEGKPALTEVYDIHDVHIDSGVYILSDSDSRYYDLSELAYLSKAELRLARNEIYARHGNIFESEDLQAYFGSMDWYIPNKYTYQVEREFNKYEEKNIATILKLEKGYAYDYDGSYDNVVNNTFILPDARFRYYSKSELSNLTKYELRLARNEIYAWHGNIFASEDLDSYFMSKSWYTPAEGSDTVERMFNKYEEKNIETIKELEESYGSDISYSDDYSYNYSVYSNSYILPESASRYYSKSELYYLSKDELRFARNEIYARHGNIFKSSDLEAYFNSKSWYVCTKNTDEVEREFNKYEEKNIKTIKELEESYGSSSSSNSSSVYSSTYILPDSASRYYSKSELSYLSKAELRLARNEIYARHGNIFVSDDLETYFNSKSWYYPSKSTEAVEREFNKYEEENIDTIKDLEN